MTIYFLIIFVVNHITVSQSSIQSDIFAFAGRECTSNENCTGLNNNLLECRNNICLCNTSVSHHVFVYLDISNQEKLYCQSLSVPKCVGPYEQRKCSCGTGKVSFLLAGKMNGICTQDDSAWSEYGQFCSGIRTACNATKGLWCRSRMCGCHQSTHEYNGTAATCAQPLPLCHEEGHLQYLDQVIPFVGLFLLVACTATVLWYRKRRQLRTPQTPPGGRLPSMNDTATTMVCDPYYPSAPAIDVHSLVKPAHDELPSYEDAMREGEPQSSRQMIPAPAYC